MLDRRCAGDAAIGTATDGSARRQPGIIDATPICRQPFDEPASGFEPLRKLPAGKQGVLGLVTTQQGETDQQRSKIAAMPWPPPMHIVTSA